MTIVTTITKMYPKLLLKLNLAIMTMMIRLTTMTMMMQMMTKIMTMLMMKPDRIR